MITVTRRRYKDGDRALIFSLSLTLAKYTFPSKAMRLIPSWRSRLRNPALAEVGQPIRMQSAKGSGSDLLASAEDRTLSETF